jgi:Helix-turn-helix domain
VTVFDARAAAFGDLPAAPTGLAPVGGFVALPNAVLLASGLSRDAKLLYAVLLHHARQRGSCFPGRDRLQAALGCGHHQLAAYLRELEASGLVARRRRGPGRTTLYTLRPLPSSGIPAPAGPGEEAPCPHARPVGIPRGMPTPSADVAEASLRAPAAPAPRPARNRHPDTPETGTLIRPKPAAEGDSGDQHTVEQQQHPPLNRLPDGGAKEGDTAVVALLVEQGVTRGVAEALAARHPAAAIRRQVACHRHRVTAAGLTRNPAGALVRAIREDWAPPATWTAAQARAIALARQAEEERWRAEEEAARRREQEARPPEERIAGRLQFWLAGRRAKRHEPTAAEIAVRRAELLAELAGAAAAGGVS